MKLSSASPVLLAGGKVHLVAALEGRSLKHSFFSFFPSQTNVICFITINFFKIIVIIIIFISKDNKRCAKCNKKVTNIVNRVSNVCNKRK